MENECVCFHTRLYTPQYKGIYGYFERNNFSDSLRDWYFIGFCDELSPKLRYIEPLLQKPVYHMAQSGINFNPEWPIRNGIYRCSFRAGGIRILNPLCDIKLAFVSI